MRDRGRHNNIGSSHAGKPEEIRSFPETVKSDVEQYAEDIKDLPQNIKKIPDDIKDLPQEVEGAVASGVSSTQVHYSRIQKKLAELESPQDLKSDIEKAIKSKWYDRVLSAPVDDLAIDEHKLPTQMKVFAVLCLVAAALGISWFIWAMVETTGLFSGGRLNDLGTSTIVVTYIRLVDLFALSCVFLVFGIRLLKNQRHYAAITIYLAYVLILIGACCSVMLYGASLRSVVYLGMFAVLVVFQVYLDPKLRKERIEYFDKKNAKAKEEQEKGILGRDLTGKGFIELNFFNLFWIFVVASFLGDVMESIVHVAIVDPGQWQDRAGLLFGPFSPIYGFGALIMTLFLNRFYKRNVILIFFVSAVLGGAFEFFVSYWMQYTYGAVAWNYTGQFLSIDGRTCGWAMGCWGLLGVLWIKLLLPAMLWLIDKIPWNWRYAITTVAAAFMAVDCIMTLMALDCWYERLAGRPVVSDIQQFFNAYFDNTWMADRFQSMTIDPSSAIRGGQ